MMSALDAILGYVSASHGGGGVRETALEAYTELAELRRYKQAMKWLDGWLHADDKRRIVEGGIGGYRLMEEETLGSWKTVGKGASVIEAIENAMQQEAE